MGMFDDVEDEEEQPNETEVVEVDNKDTHNVDTVNADSVNGRSLVTPVDDIEKVAEVYEKFTEIKEKILDSNDTVTISGNPHVTKSGWRKIATAFNVSTEVVSDSRIVEDGVVKYKVTVKATAPNGKTVTSTSICASNESNHMEKLAGEKDNVEKMGHSIDDEDVLKVDGVWRRLKEPKEVNDHNLLATAETRAKNRAISDLVGGGEVSAEEISKEMVFD